MENKIRQLRLKKGWSQRQLAQAVGTSQQQIQRFETGSPVKLQMAGAIASALGVTVPAVFPGSGPGLKRVFRKEDTAEAYTNDEIEESLLEAGIESDPTLWTARILLRGGDPNNDVHLYRIGVADRKRVESGYLSGDSKGLGFFHFDSNDIEVLINLDHVIFWQNCWDPPFMEHEEHVEEPSCGIEVYFAGQKQPLRFDVEPDGPVPESPDDEDENGHFRWLGMHLELGLDKDEFIDFVDLDGEVAHLKVGDIAIMEIARCVTHPEMLDDTEDQSESEHADENASLEPLRKKKSEGSKMEDESTKT